MIEINSNNNNELKRYLDSYKRLFFRKQLDNPNSKLILDKKRESLGLTKDEVDAAGVLLNKSLNDAIIFVQAIMDLNESTEIDKDELVEIREYFEDLKLEEDIDSCIEFAKSLHENKEVLITKEEDKKAINVEADKVNDLNEEMENIKVQTKQLNEELLECKEDLEIEDHLEVEETTEETLENEKVLEENLENEQYEEIEIKTIEVLDDKDEILEETLEIEDEQKAFGEFEEEIEASNINEEKSFLVYDQDMLLGESSLDEILNMETRDFRIETLKVLFYNGCIVCVERFKDNIFNINGRRNFTYENIKSAFYDGYSELIDYTHAFLTKEGINDNTMEKEKLFEKIFGLQCLTTLSKQIHKINIMVDNLVTQKQIDTSIDRSVGIYRTNSDKAHFKTYAVRAISRDINIVFETAKYDFEKRDNIEQGIYRLILEAVSFINKCGLANFDIYTEDHGRTLNVLLEEKAKAKELVGRFEDEDENINVEYYKVALKQAIINYPFYEDTYIAISRLEEKVINKYKLLMSAIELLNKCGEKDSALLEEIKSVELELYTEEINNIPVDLNMDIKIQICAENIRKFNISGNFDIIFETEIKHFGYLVTDMDINLVNEEARISAFRKELEIIKTQDSSDEERMAQIEEFKKMYYIRNWECFKVEYAVFGKSFEGKVFDDLDRNDRRTILDYCMKSIMENASAGVVKRDLLSELQDREIIDKKEFREIEKNIFGFVIPLNEDENKEFEFMEKINYIYRDINDDLKALDFSVRNKKWNIELPHFYSSVKGTKLEKETIIMCYSEDDKNKKSKEGFILTNESLYSSYSNKIVNISDIDTLKIRNYSKVIKGERIVFEGIFVSADLGEFKLCSNSMKSKDEFVAMLNSIVAIYRTVHGLPETITFEEDEEDDMLLGIDNDNLLLGNKKMQEELRVNLEGNKFYELMSDILNYDNLSFKEILAELSTLVKSELAKKIFFNEITEGSGEKIREACTSYVMTISELEEIYVVIDNTKKFPLQFQKLGVAISSKGIYCKNKLEDPWFIDIKYITNIKTKDENKVQVTNRVIEFTNVKSKKELYEMRDLVEFIVVLRKIMDNPLEEVSQEINEMGISNAEKFTIELANSIKSEELRKLLFIHSEGSASEKKYAQAMSSYADLNDSEAPILLLDTTTFGLKSSGFLITDKSFYYRESMGNSMEINLFAISRVYIKEDRLYINGIEIKLSGLSKEDKIELSEKLKKLFDYLKSVK